MKGYALDTVGEDMIFTFFVFIQLVLTFNDFQPRPGNDHKKAQSQQSAVWRRTGGKEHKSETDMRDDYSLFVCIFKAIFLIADERGRILCEIRKKEGFSIYKIVFLRFTFSSSSLLHPLSFNWSQNKILEEKLKVNKLRINSNLFL